MAKQYTVTKLVLEDEKKKKKEMTWEDAKAMFEALRVLFDAKYDWLASWSSDENTINATNCPSDSKE